MDTCYIDEKGVRSRIQEACGLAECNGVSWVEEVGFEWRSCLARMAGFLVKSQPSQPMTGNKKETELSFVLEFREM